MSRMPVIAPLPDYTDLGQAPTPTDRAPIVEDNSTEVLGQGVERAGMIAVDAQKEAQDKADVEAKNLARAQSANAAIDHEIAVRNVTDNIQQQVQSGQLPYAQASAEFKKQSLAIPVPQITNLDPVGKENYGKLLRRNLMTSQLAMNGIVRTAQKNDYLDQFEAARDKLDKLAGMPGANIDDINGRLEAFKPLALNAGIPAEKVDKAIQDFKDRNWLNQATQRAMESKESLPALKTLQQDLTSADGFYAGKLDTEKRNTVLREVTNDQIMLQNRIEHEQDKREMKAQSALNRMDEQISTGVPATPDMWDQLQQTVKGTSFEAEGAQRLKAEQQVQDVLRQSPTDQVKYVQQKTQDLMTNGGTMRDRANLMRLSAAVNQNQQLMEKNPLLFAANRNGTTPQPLDLSGMGTPEGQQTIGATVADRMATLATLRKQYGPQIGLQPLLPQESAQLTNVLQSSPPAQRAQLLTGLHQSIGNDEAYQAIMREIAPHSPVTAIAGSMLGNAAPNNQPTWFDPKLAPTAQDATTVIRGEALLNPGLNGAEAGKEEEKGRGAIKSGMPLPPDAGVAGLRFRFGRAAGELFAGRPDLADAHYSVFKAAYASLLAQKGDMKGQGDPTLEKQALKIALGNQADFHGQTLAVPAGMDPSKFEGNVEAAVAAAAKSYQAPGDWADRIRGFQLQEMGGLGSGQYKLINGNTELVRPDGKGLFVVDLRKQYLPSNMTQSHSLVPSGKGMRDQVTVSPGAAQ